MPGNIIMRQSRLAPEYADPWFGLGIIALETGAPDDAMIFLRKAVRLDDENPEIWYMLGKAHYAKNEKKDTLTMLQGGPEA